MRVLAPASKSPHFFCARRKILLFEKRLSQFSGEKNYSLGMGDPIATRLDRNHQGCRRSGLAATRSASPFLSQGEPGPIGDSTESCHRWTTTAAAAGRWRREVRKHLRLWVPVGRTFPSGSGRFV